jgi:hypothetical protein
MAMAVGLLLSCSSSGTAGGAGGSGKAPASTAGKGETWQELIHEAHRGSVKDPLPYVELVNANLAPEAPGREELGKVRELTGGEALPVKRSELVGSWRCRSIQASSLGIFAYPFFRCRISESPEGLRFQKVTGSQRRSGYLFEDGGRRFVFLGGQHVNDDPARFYSGMSGDFDGEDLAMDTAGILQKKGKDRFLMILDAGPEKYELYELVR